MSIEEYNHLFIKNKTKALENLLELIDKAKNLDKEYNIFETIIDNPYVGKNTSLISGTPYTLKDNFSTKGILTTASSNSLKDYIPVFDATVYKKLNDAGAVMIGKTTMDELALGGTGTTGHLGPVKNAYNKELISGGSSSGSAVSVALDLVPFSIGSDTGDSVRKPAAYNGVVGFKPSYGLVSRYGLFPFATSLDTVGVLSKTVLDAAMVTNEIKGKDEKDMTSYDSSDIDLVENIKVEPTSKKLFYIKELVDMSNFEDVTDNNYIQDIIMKYSEVVSDLKNKGYIVEGISIDKELLKAIYPAYLVISCSEATSNDSNLTGIIFGPKSEGKTSIEKMKNFRGENFCSLIKRRFVIGSYSLEKENQEKYFLNAKRIRRMLVDILDKTFSEYDALILPVGNGYIPKIGEKYSIKDEMESALDNHLILGNFGGYPSITLPVSIVNNFPFAINITSQRYEDKKLLNLAYDIEKILKEGEKDV